MFRIDKTGPDPDRYSQLHPAAPYQAPVRGNRRNHPDPRPGNQAGPSISQGSSLATPRRQQLSFPQQLQVLPTAVSTLPGRFARDLDANRKTVKAVDQSAVTSAMASQTVPVESSDGNKLIANTDEVPTALPPASPRLSVVDILGSASGGIPTSIEYGGFSAIENRDGDVPSDTIIAEKTQDSVMESVSFVNSSTGATSMLNDASIDDIASSSLSDEEEDSIAKVIEDLFGEETSEPDSALGPPSLLDLHEVSPLRMSPPPNAETEKDLNDRARSRSPSHHSIQSTPPRNCSASVRSASPPPRASSHDRHSIRSTPPRNPSPHLQSVSNEKRQSPATRLSPLFRTPIQTATSPVILASSPPPELNYEGRGDQEMDVDSIIDQDRNVFSVSSRDALPFFDLTFAVS